MSYLFHDNCFPFLLLETIIRKIKAVMRFVTRHNIDSIEQNSYSKKDVLSFISSSYFLILLVNVLFCLTPRYNKVY